MKPNNLYYRQIAESLTGESYSKLYSNSYYARKIAEYYNEEEYTGRKPLNKYLKEWYIKLTGETAPSNHKINLWYLRRITEYLDDTVDDDLNENQCLRIISENIVPSPTSVASIELTSTKTILSYADSESATLTATAVDDNDNPVEDISIKLYKDDVLWDTLTTDENGQVSKSYSSTGAGNIEFGAVYDSYTLSDPLIIEDCLFANALTSNDGLFTVASGKAIMNYSENGLSFTGNSLMDTIANLTYQLPNDDYTVEYVVTGCNSGGYTSDIVIEDGMWSCSGSSQYFKKYSASGNIWTISHQYTPPSEIKWEITGTTSKTIECYEDEELVGTATSISQTRTFRLTASIDSNIIIKDLRIKPLGE